MKLAIVQARQSSKRLPNKVLKEVNGKPIISILLHRLSLAKMIDKVLSYTGSNNTGDLIELYCGVGTFSMPLASCFNKVFVTENNRSSIKCLKQAVIKNDIKIWIFI